MASEQRAPTSQEDPKRSRRDAVCFEDEKTVENTEEDPAAEGADQPHRLRARTLPSEQMVALRQTPLSKLWKRSRTVVDNRETRRLLAERLEPGHIIVDWVIRTKNATAGGSVLRVKEWFHKKLMSSYPSAEMVEAAMNYLERDQLLGFLFEAIVVECKQRGIYKKTGIPALRDVAIQVREFKRMGMLLRRDVDNWLFTAKVREGANTTVVEPYSERKKEAEDFWNFFQQQARPPFANSYVVSDYRPQPISPIKAWFTSPAVGRKARPGVLDDESKPASPGSVHHGDKSRMLYSGETARPMTTMSKPGTSLGQLRHQREGLMLSRDLDADRAGGRKAMAMNKSSSLPCITRPMALVGDPGGKVSPDRRPVTSGAAIGGGKPLPPLLAGRRKYIKECELRKTMPKPRSFVAGRSKQLLAVDGGLMDSELLSITAMLQEWTSLEDVSLQNNALLTDRGMAPFLRELQEVPVCNSLRSLKLGRCRGVGLLTVDATIQLVHVAGNLKFLDLNSIQLATKLHLPLANAIGDHPYLENVWLAETGLGSSSGMTRECLSRILSSMSLKDLDLSWNCLARDDLRHLGLMLNGSKSMRKLTVDNCVASSVPGADTAIDEFIETLSSNRNLESLSLQMNRIGWETALVMEDSLSFNGSLTSLDVSQNTLGKAGIRNLMRLVCRSSNKIRHFHTEGCFTGGDEFADSDTPIYSFTNPGGRYVLDLSRAYCRSLLRMLHKYTARFQLPLEQVFVNIDYSLGTWKHLVNPGFGKIWEVPNQGVLSITFSLEAELDAVFVGSVPDDDFLAFLEKYYATVRFRMAWDKVTPLLAKWHQIEGSAMQQEVYLAAISKDFRVSVPQLEIMCKASRSMTNRTIDYLLPTIPDTGPSRYMAMMMFPQLQDFMASYTAMESLLTFNVRNPNGHYCLDLGHGSDYAVAQRLMLLDRWESVINKRLGRQDTSARGNRSHFNNETHQGRDLHLRVNSVAEWSLPEFDQFEFDYSSSWRRPEDAEPLTDELWEKIMTDIYISSCKPRDKLKVLRQMSHNIFISSFHMRQLLGYFKTAEDRAEALVIYILRVVDPQNSKLWEVRFTSFEERQSLRHRLGFVTIFPFWQPENQKFDLDLNFNDQRIAGQLLVKLALVEKRANLRDPTYILADGTQDPMTMGVPMAWGDKMPVGGRFMVTYCCSGDDRQFKERKKLAISHGYQKVQNIQEDDVQWWTGLSEVPEDVLELLEFFISRVANMDEAFRIMDAAGNGTGHIGLRALETGLTQMQCHKFTGPNEKARIGALFRYLDLGGEGTISRKEWAILGQLWKEFSMTIREFVQFMIFAFGSRLEDAWEMLDEDGGGEICESEWMTAVQHIGYFGPAMVVFGLLDVTDDGSISYDEFEVLEKYRPARSRPGSRSRPNTTS